MDGDGRIRLSRHEGRSLLWHWGRGIFTLVCTAAVLAAPATALASGGSPLHPDPSPATTPAAPPSHSGSPGALAPDSSQTPAKAAPVRAVAPSAPVTRAVAPPVHVASTPPAPVRKAAHPAKRPTVKHVTPAPLHLGIRYAPPPPFTALSRDRFMLPAALALLMLLVSSGSFLGLVFRIRRELVKV